MKTSFGVVIVDVPRDRNGESPVGQNQTTI
jgi:hypothetical protein